MNGTGSLAETQRALVAALRASDGAGAGIYRKLVRRGLADMLRFQLPRTAARLGPRWSADVTRFLDATLPRSHYLRDVAFELFAFIEPSWREDPEVPRHIVDLARHELLAFDVANAPDDPPLGEAAPLALDRRVALSSSARVVRYSHAVHLLPEDDASLEEPAPTPAALCVYRDSDHEIRHLALTPSAAEIVERLAAGALLGEAVSGAAAACGSPLGEPFLRGAAALLEDLTARGVVRGSIGVPVVDG